MAYVYLLLLFAGCYGLVKLDEYTAPHVQHWLGGMYTANHTLYRTLVPVIQTALMCCMVFIGYLLRILYTKWSRYE